MVALRVGAVFYERGTLVPALSFKTTSWRPSEGHGCGVTFFSERGPARDFIESRLGAASLDMRCHVNGRVTSAFMVKSLPPRGPLLDLLHRLPRTNTFLSAQAKCVRGK
jgi:hypothetical protein